MNFIDSSVEIIDDINSDLILKKIELALRNCYKSENLIEDGSAEKLIKSCINRGHESPLEHVSITYRVICDRGVSHEWVRHRLASYSQESSRYCNYTKGKFGSEITYIKPEWFDEYQSLILKPSCDTTQEEYDKISIYFAYKKALKTAELSYFTMIRNGATPDIARAVLPNSLKTDLVCTMNIRELRNFFKLRCTKYAHPAIRKLAIELLQKLKEKGLGILFEDIIYD